MTTLDFGRPTVAAQAVGIAQGALDHALHYASTREQFGKPIASLQGLQFMLADMDTMTSAARELTPSRSRAGPSWCSPPRSLARLFLLAGC